MNIEFFQAYLPYKELSYIRTFVKSLSIYTLTSFLSPMVALILAPFLTHSLTRAEYGTLAVLNTIIALVAGITQLGLASAFFRAYSCDYDSRGDQVAILSTTFMLLCLVSIPLATIIIITAPRLAAFLFNNTSLASALRIAATVVLLQNLTIPGLSWLRAEERALSYSFLSIVNLLVSLVATLVLVGIFHMGMNGSLLAIGGGYAAIVVCTLPVLLLRFGLRQSLHLHLGIAWNLLSFGLPLVFSFISAWIIQLSDRYLLSRLGSVSETASYSVAYVLGGILSTVLLGPFSLAWPSTMYTIAKRTDAAHVFQLVFRWYFIVLLFASFGLSLAAIAVLTLFFPPAYQTAAPIIPIVAAAVMFYGLYHLLAVGISIRRKTWIAFIFTAVSAIINVVLNLILIPLYGSMGAAISTLAAYLALILAIYIANQRIYPIRFEIGLFSAALFIGVVLYLLSLFLSYSQTRYVSWGIDACALGLYGICLVSLGKLPMHNHKNNISAGELARAGSTRPLQRR